MNVDESKTYQVFFIGLYHWDAESKSFVSTVYGYVPTVPGTPNDINFFRTAMDDFIEEILKVMTPTSISLWTDNARQHFKQRFSMKYVADLRRRLRIPLVWNFTTEHHPPGLCDTAARTVKHNVVAHQRENEEIITEARQITKIIHQTSNYVGRQVHVERFSRKGKHLNGISKCFKFDFSEDGKEVRGYLTSNESVHAQSWKV